MTPRFQLSFQKPQLRLFEWEFAMEGNIIPSEGLRAMLAVLGKHVCAIFNSLFQVAMRMEELLTRNVAPFADKPPDQSNSRGRGRDRLRTESDLALHGGC